MNCLECCDHIQRILDGGHMPADLEAHLTTCKSCRELHALSRGMLHGLSQMSRPVPPAGFADAIVRSVLRDRARRRRRRWLVGASAAAAVVLALVGVFRLTRPDSHVTVVSADRPDASQPSLQENVQQAGQALADLTLRTAAETLQTSRTFVPAVEFTGATDPQVVLPDMPAESRRAWNDAVGGVSVGLEPLAESARQAASFFRREVPLLGQDSGSGM
jgi:hypothetical protein